ncbi:hypothetical protein [Halobacillus seohaensis]|uniref:Uncharacterized protein n=1 Tax=Halobacillus seohaensis TaxID=447421 RepID=A0ABW2EMT2_9BACI
MSKVSQLNQKQLHEIMLNIYRKSNEPMDYTALEVIREIKTRIISIQSIK